jgi:hypothetical protein
VGVPVRVGVHVRVGVFVLVGVRDAVGVLLGVGVRLGVRVLVGVGGGGEVEVTVGDGPGVAGDDVGVAVGVRDGVGEVVAVALGTSPGASKRTSAARSAAVTCPSSFTSACPLTSACGQPSPVSPKIVSATADRSAASSTLSQLASPGGNWAAAVAAHTRQHAAVQRATGRVKPRQQTEIIRELAHASNALLPADLQYDLCATCCSQ